ncbi:MAG: hypothetical protein M1609_15695 [Firmicutes bacterium]|nr:hypothetical protein [Bacillota bacterium]
MIPKDPEDININASQQGLLEIAEHFFRRKVKGRKEKNGDNEELIDLEKEK